MSCKSRTYAVSVAMSSKMALRLVSACSCEGHHVLPPGVFAPGVGCLQELSCRQGWPRTNWIGITSLKMELKLTAPKAGLLDRLITSWLFNIGPEITGLAFTSSLPSTGVLVRPKKDIREDWALPSSRGIVEEAGETGVGEDGTLSKDAIDVIDNRGWCCRLLKFSYRSKASSRCFVGSTGDGGTDGNIFSVSGG